MKTIGLLGGMSWESTTLYYRIINRVIREKLGGLHSAKCVVYSVDFQEIEHCQAQGRWAEAAEILGRAALGLKKAGADFLVIATNTMHKVAADIQKRSGLPLIHIAEVTAEEILAAGLSKVALLGTQYTMEEDFYKQKIIDMGLEVIVPDMDGREYVNHVIYEELCLGLFYGASRVGLMEIVGKLREEGALGVILGCTELALLLGTKDFGFPVFDTTEIHARRAALMAI